MLLHLPSMAQFGSLTLCALLLVATWSGALALVGVRRRSARMVHAARYTLYAAAGIASVAVTVLSYTFAVSDFSLTYVFRYSEQMMPLFYRLTALWGGQEGSLLLWAWLLAVLAAVAVHVNQERLRHILPHVIVVVVVVLDFFCLVMLLTADPFTTFLVQRPASGQGLNPLLQNPFMVVHPPALYLGYVTMAIPFSFAIGALLSGHTDEAWVDAARPWALAAWYCLGLGLVLGMVWAYEELGWGGYWGWDPVENAGLIPWFTSTACLHSMLVQQRRRMLKKWTMLLTVLTFLLTIFGTFLTRSGFIESVHAFAKSSIGWYFLGFMAFVLVVTLVLIIWRAGRLRGPPIESLLSRESVFILVNCVLVISAFLVLLLTIFPTLSQLVGEKRTIDPQIFKLWMIPLGLILLLLKGVGPTLAWRRTRPERLPLLLLASAGIGLAVAAGLWALGVRGWLPLLTFGLCAFVTTTVIQDLLTRTLSRRRSSGAGLLPSMGGVLLRSLRRYGAYLIHVGVVLMYLGFAGDAYKQERELVMSRGQRVTLGDYTLRYDGIEREVDDQKQMTTATLSVYANDSAPPARRIATLHPARWVYFKHERQPTSEVDIRRSVREDLFVILGGFDIDKGTAAIKVVINKLVSWIWIGFVLLTLGALITLIPVGVRTEPSGADGRKG